LSGTIALFRAFDYRTDQYINLEITKVQFVEANNQLDAESVLAGGQSTCSHRSLTALGLSQREHDWQLLTARPLPFSLSL
jgi:hypothetical protein